MFLEVILIRPGSFEEAFSGLKIELHTLILNAGVMALPQRLPGVKFHLLEASDDTRCHQRWLK